MVSSGDTTMARQSRYPHIDCTYKTAKEALPRASGGWSPGCRQQADHLGKRQSPKSHTKRRMDILLVLYIVAALLRTEAYTRPPEDLPQRHVPHRLARDQCFAVTRCSSLLQRKSGRVNSLLIHPADVGVAAGQDRHFHMYFPQILVSLFSC